MFWSAASATVLLLGASQAQLSERDRSSWRRVEPSLAMLFDGSRPIGAAGLIDESGLFVAASAAVSGNTVQAKVGDKSFRMQVINRERNSGLVLLQAESYAGTARVLRAPNGDAPSGAFYAALASGPIRAGFSSVPRFAVLDTRRGVPISELRFESPSSQFGTAILVSESGELFGAVRAALPRADANMARVNGNVRNNLASEQTIGPAELTVAYAIGPVVVRRVIEGFLSPTHEVVFPSLGVFCVDAVGGGALVQSVTQGSPAAASGILAGDTLLDIGGQGIRHQLDFSRVMLDQAVGRRVPIRLRRGSEIQIRDVVIGRAAQ